MENSHANGPDQPEDPGGSGFWKAQRPGQQRAHDDGPGAAGAVGAVREFLDRYHHRASVTGGGKLMLDPGKLLENIKTAMERVDLDIDTPISVEEDVASFDEIHAMVSSMRMGTVLAAHVLNTSVAVLAPRYPAELVFGPLPAHFDLRVLMPGFVLDDHVQAAAIALYNQRLASPADVRPSDIADTVDPLSDNDQIGVFIALFYIHGVRTGALQHRTGTS